MSQRDRQRIQVHIVQIRAQDVLAGDVVNRSGAIRDGWVEMAYIEQLPDGRLNLCDESYRKSFVSEPLDLIWLQIAVNLKGNSHMPVDIPMYYEPVRVQAALPAGSPTEVEARASSTQA